MSLPASFVCCVHTFFFFNDTATTEIYTLSLHDALPISMPWACCATAPPGPSMPCTPRPQDRKSTRLNSSHTVISYAVFCLKKKKRIALRRCMPLEDINHSALLPLISETNLHSLRTTISA